jgi:hypothetical protein
MINLSINLPNYINAAVKIAFKVSPALLLLLTLSVPSLAETDSRQPEKSQSNPNKTPTKNPPTASLIQFPSLPDRGQPKRTGAAGRRGNSCVVTQKDEPSLTAIMPTWDNEGKTVNTKSTLYVFVPQNNTKTGEFVVIDDQGNDIYQTKFTPPNQAGIVPVNIPASANIQIGKKYQWYFTLICNPDDRSEDEYLTGTLERTTLGSLLNRYVQQATPLRQAEIYARQNIWYDTIHNIASLRSENPELWISLLESVGLEELVNQPFIDFGQAQQ